MKTFNEIFVKLDQVGMITPIDEVDELKRNLIDVFQLGPGDVYGGTVARHENTVYRGELQSPGPAIRMDFFNKENFPVELEFLSPVDGNSAWMEYYQKARKGIHHIRFNVSSHDDAVQYMKAHGIEVFHVADSPRGAGIKFAYYDSYDKLGFYIETINLAEFEGGK
jgi:catechol 2,3-dioxygenase-like lactoylglutathione lyase family enzyme